MLRGGAGGPSDEVTPVPIPNTEVKLVSSDGTWTQPGPGRVARCRNVKTSPKGWFLRLPLDFFVKTCNRFNVI